MEGGPPSFTQGFTSPALLWYANPKLSDFRLQDYHLLWSNFPDRSANGRSGNVSARNPREQAPWFGLFRFRSPLLTESRLISFPAGTEMFQFPAFAPDGLCIQPQVMPSGCPVTTGCPIRRSRD